MDNVAGIFGRRRELYAAVKMGRIDQGALELLLPNGAATADESPLWDYKISLPIPVAGRGNATTKQAHDAKMAETIKDCVAFYNSYGGYIVTGVDDTSREVRGFAGSFDAADLNKRIQGATGVNIETIYAVLDASHIEQALQIGILYIPQRPTGLMPAQFKRSAPDLDNGRRAYSAGDFYLRERDMCRPAVSPEDFEFLYGSRTLEDSGYRNFFLENNLPAREQDFVRLIGRDREISDLWMWIADVFSPIKILSGLGGVGKTSIAYTFSERIIYHGPNNIDRLVWLGAKTETFSGELNKLVPTSRTDFSKIDELLVQLLLHTGCPPEQIPDDPTREDLLGLCQQHLSAFTYFLVVDNVDTLTDEEQQTVFHVLTQLCSVSRTKCIITARRNLGAPRAVYMEIEGLDYGDFVDFVNEKAKLLKVQVPPPASSEMKQFYEDSGGSPLFALSTLRLVALGDNFSAALNNWRGSDGEAVREAAFKREVGRLSAHEAKVLLVLCYLKSASIVQLSSILKLTRFEIQRALETLQAFSMTRLDTSLPGGADFAIPNTLALVTSIVERRVPDAAGVHEACSQYKKISENRKPFIGEVVSRAISHLREGDPLSAEQTALAGLQRLPDDGDLTCLLGRCQFERKDYASAISTFQKAHALGCRKRDLYFGWIAAYEARQDWKNIIEIAVVAEDETGAARFRIDRNRARMQLGDERARSGDYSAAASTYEEAMNDASDGMRRYVQAGDRAEIRRQIEVLVLRWVGAIGVQASASGEGGRRMFGAYYRAFFGFHICKESIIVGALSSLSDWVSRVAVRRALSETGREHLELARTRLARFREELEAQADRGIEPAPRHLKLALSLDASIEDLLTR